MLTYKSNIATDHFSTVLTNAHSYATTSRHVATVRGATGMMQPHPRPDRLQER